MCCCEAHWIAIVYERKEKKSVITYQTPLNQSINQIKAAFVSMETAYRVTLQFAGVSLSTAFH